MKARSHSLRISAIGILLLVSLVLAACLTQPENLTSPNLQLPQNTPENAGSVLTQVQENAVNRAAATAEMMRANAQATLDSANATLSAAQIQQQNSADVIAAQVAAAARIAQANAQATVVSASSTQNAAQTQDAYQQTQVQGQQNRDQIAAATQTVVANLIATQTQSALATSQWYADQSRQRQEQSQSSIAMFETLCLPISLIVIIGLFFGGLWYWLKIQQANQNILDNSVEKVRHSHSQADVVDYPQDKKSRFHETNGNDSRYKLTKPVDQARRWIDDIRRQVQSSNRKDQDDHPDN
jgi:hypothetical protein